MMSRPLGSMLSRAATPKRRMVAPEFRQEQIVAA
jgi:hypothetical protein